MVNGIWMFCSKVELGLSNRLVEEEMIPWNRKCYGIGGSLCNTIVVFTLASKISQAKSLGNFYVIIDKRRNFIIALVII